MAQLSRKHRLRHTFSPAERDVEKSDKLLRFHINSASLFIKSHALSRPLPRSLLVSSFFDRLFLCYFQFPLLTFILEFYGFGRIFRRKLCVCERVCRRGSFFYSPPANSIGTTRGKVLQFEI
jgi:hypothetical protein